MKTYSSTPGIEKYNHIGCNLCGNESRKLLWDCGSFKFFRCADCGLIYQYPQPRQTDLSFRYDKDYFDYEIQNEQQFFGLMRKTLEDIDFKGLTADRFSGNPVFLDIGCATGLLIDHMRNEGWDVKGVELCTPSAEYGRNVRGLDISNTTLEEAGFSSSSIDIVHSSHLVEHLTDPVSYFKEAFRILKPGGFLITSTPNTGSLQAALFRNKWRSAIADHMYLFSVKTLSAMISERGFDLMRRGTWGGMAAGTVPLFIKKPLDFFAKKLGFGDVMVILARKPV